MSQPSTTSSSNNRFRYTLDGSDALENKIDEINRRVTEDIHKIVPTEKIDALVLAGGYGRGEGGVYLRDGREHLYNDLDYYLFLKGNKRANEADYGAGLKAIEKARSPEADCDVEFKIDSITQLESSPVSMFSYDLVAKSYIADGNPSVFENCSKHLDHSKIPPSEATRLLFNRCSGLIFSRDLLNQSELSDKDLEFVQRNFSKVELAMGDAILTVLGKYQWSCQQRQRVLSETKPIPGIANWDKVVGYHRNGVDFKFHPAHNAQSMEEHRRRYESIREAVKSIWFWVENQRLGETLSDPLSYANAKTPRCPDQPRWRNLLVNIKQFGLGALTQPHATLYQRDLMYRAMGLLLWEDDSESADRIKDQLSFLLRTKASNRAGFVKQYESLWHRFG